MRGQRLLCILSTMSSFLNNFLFWTIKVRLHWQFHNGFVHFLFPIILILCGSWRGTSTNPTSGFSLPFVEPMRTCINCFSCDDTAQDRENKWLRFLVFFFLCNCVPFLTSKQPVSSMLTPVSGIDATPQTRDLSARLSVGQPLVVVAVFFAFQRCQHCL